MLVLLVFGSACGGETVSDGDAGTSGESDGGGASVPSRGICEAHCTCEGCAGSWVSDCTTNRLRMGEMAAADDCAAEWSALEACLATMATCSGGSFLLGGCEPQESALVDCRR